MTSKNFSKNAKRAKKASIGMQISLTNGGFTSVDTELYDYLNQWKWFRLDSEDGGHAARFEYYVTGDLALIYMEDQIMGMPSYPVKFECLSDELREFAQIEESNVFNVRKYEMGEQVGYCLPTPPLDISDDDELIADGRVLRILSRSERKYVVGICFASQEGKVYSELDKWADKFCDHGFRPTAYDGKLVEPFCNVSIAEAHDLLAHEGRDILECDAMIVIGNADKIANLNDHFKYAIAQRLPVFNISSSSIRVWDYKKSDWDKFCEKPEMYKAIKAFLEEFWADGTAHSKTSSEQIPVALIS